MTISHHPADRPAHYVSYEDRRLASIRDILGLSSLAAAQQAIAAYRPRDVIELGYVESILCIRAVFRDACRQALDPALDNDLAARLQRGVTALAREMRFALAALERRQAMPLPMPRQLAQARSAIGQDPSLQPNRDTGVPAPNAAQSAAQPASRPAGRPADNTDQAAWDRALRARGLIQDSGDDKDTAGTIGHA